MRIYTAAEIDLMTLEELVDYANALADLARQLPDSRDYGKFSVRNMGDE